MSEIKKEISIKDKQLKEKLNKTLRLICAGLCVVMVGTTLHHVKSEKELNDIVSKYEISELRFYFDGKEVNVEELKKQQEFYRNFGKQEQSKNVKKFQKTSVKYDKKITTKQKKYHRKG